MAAEAVAPLVDLSDGNKMPILGLGTWESQPCDIKEAVKHAIKVHCRQITGMVKNMGPRLRDPASWLPLAADAGNAT